MSGEVVLSSGERILWADRPHGWRGFLRSTDAVLIAFALFGSFFFVTAILATPGADRSFSVVGFFFPLVFFGFFFFVPRLIGASREAGGTSYTLTDRRIVLRNRHRNVELDLANLQHLELERSWLSGPVIFFGSRMIYEGWGAWYGGSPTPAIRGVPDAERVYGLISDARSQAQRAGR